MQSSMRLRSASNNSSPKAKIPWLIPLIQRPLLVLYHSSIPAATHRKRLKSNDLGTLEVSFI
jgi:hypothetical protein